MRGRGQGQKRRQAQQSGSRRKRSVNVNQSSSAEGDGARGEDVGVESGGGQRKNLESGRVKEPAGNPMLNQVVLSRLFAVCELTDLRRFRLVNKQWYDLSLTRWREKMTLKMDHNKVKTKIKSYSCSDYDSADSGDVRYWRRDGMVRQEEMELYNSPEFSKLQLKPFNNYHLSEVELTPHNTDNFFNTCGPSTRKLEMLHSTFYDLEYFRQIIFEKTPNLEFLHFDNLHWFAEDGHHQEVKAETSRDTFGKVKPQPYLKTLIVGNVWRKSGEEIEMLEEALIPWRSYFQHFPNVENLGVRYLDDIKMTHLADTLEQLAESGEQPMTIKSLDIRFLCGEQPEVVKRLVQQKQMKLEALEFDMGTGEDDSQSVLPLVVKLHGKTLKKLFLENESEPEDLEKMPYRNFPFISEDLISLTHLYLVGNVVSNLHFLARTPNLRVLHIIEIAKEHKSSLFERTIPSRLANLCLPHVVKLHFAFKVNPASNLSNTHTISGEHMRMITELMPAVQRFQSPLSLGAMRVVCENWKDLRSLRMSASTSWITDSEITGIIGGRVERVPSISDLKYLRELSIRQGPDENSSLKDDSVYNGFLKMPALHTLSVTMSEYTSNEAFLALFNKFPGMGLRRDIPIMPKMKKERKILNNKLQHRGILWQRNFCSMNKPFEIKNSSRVVLHLNV